MFIKIELDDMDREEAETLLAELRYRLRRAHDLSLDLELVTHVGRPGTLYSDCRCDDCAVWIQGKRA